MSNRTIQRFRSHTKFMAAALVAALGLGAVASSAELVPQRTEAPDVQILGPSELGQITARAVDSVFRVDRRDSKSLWNPRATAFVIHSQPDGILLATNAHVVEEEHFLSDEVSDLKPDELRVVQRGYRDEYQVTRIFKHPRRSAGMGPDVSLLEAKSVTKKNSRDAASALPPSLRLWPRGNDQSLLGNAVGLIGFPAMDGVKLSRPYFGGGVIAQENGDDQHVVYDMAADHGSSGSPVFIAVRDDLNGRASIREYVIGVHSMRHGERLKTGMHSDLIWEALAHHKLPLTEHRKDFFRPLPLDHDPTPPSSADDPQSNDNADAGPIALGEEFPRILALAEHEDFDAAAKQTAAVMQAKQVKQQTIEWQWHALAGAIAARRGIQLDLQEARNEAVPQFASAVQSLTRAKELAPQAVLPRLLLARAQNNLGRPTRTTAGDRKLLQATHDDMQELLTDDAVQLTDREKAQVNYLLGYAHLFLPCGQPEKIRNNFTSSMQNFPSKQGQEWYERTVLGLAQENALPDLWDEFTQLREAQFPKKADEETPKPKRRNPIFRFKVD